MARKGFTLLELLMVVIIVGVLAALALPQYTAFVERSRGAEAVNVIGAIKAAENVYYMAHGAYNTNPPTIGITIPAGLFNYAITGSLGGYNVQATKNVAPSNGTTILFTWTTATGSGAWTGSHPGTPRQ